MENSVADIELAREGHTAILTDMSYAAPALSTPRPFAVSSYVKVAALLFVLVYAMTKDLKLAFLVFISQIVLSKLLK
jgi:hypothetical protein